MSRWGIILAAGAGVRMGSPKAFLSIAGKPMLYYSVMAFQKAPSIDKIGIVARKEDLETAQNLCRSSAIAKLGFVTAGGKERQDSVWEGVSLLPADAQFVAIHDSARPLLTVELIEAVLQSAKETGGAIPAIPVKDTVKVARDSRVVGTLKRSLLWAAQTPQAFRLDLFKEAFQRGLAEDFYGTDCASLMENAGFPVALVEGLPQNIKITSPSDVAVAEAFLQASRL